MQRKRNIKLFLILLASIAAVVVAYFVTRPEDKLSVNRDIFSYKDVSNIDRVVFSSDTGKQVLTVDGNQWEVNNEYKADPRRVSVLFAILKQMRVRRKVAKQHQDTIRKKLKNKGTRVTFYEGDDAVHHFYAWGDNSSKLTYVARSPEHQPYIVEIPGYRNFLAGIFLLDENGWRDPLLFNMNWSNLNNVKVIYPQEPEAGFNIKYDDGFYYIPEVGETDSTKLVDFLDDISLLYVNDYLNEREEQAYSNIIDAEPLASIQVEDVGNNVYTLEIYDNLPEGNEIIGKIDSAEYAVFDSNKIRRILRPAHFFNLE